MDQNISLESELAKILLFTGLTTAERNQILTKVMHEKYKANEIIIRAEQGSTDVFFVLQGKVEISVRTNTGQKIYFELITEGNFFGDFSAIDDEPRSAGVIASTDTRLLRMPQETFLSLLILHPRIALQLMRRLVAIIRSSNTKIVDIATLTVIERMYNYYLTHGSRSGPHQLCVKDLPSQSDLAAQIGATRETVSRAINKMISEQIIMRGDKGEIYVRDNINIKDFISIKQNKPAKN